MRISSYLKFLLCLILAGCANTANLQISSDYREYNYAQLKTYAWYDNAEPESKDSKINPPIYSRITEAIENELNVKAFKKSDQPDFFINFTVTASNVYDVNSYVSYSGHAPGFTWRRSGYGFSALEKQAQLDMIRKGTLVIDILDPEKDQLIWRGIAQKRLPDRPYNEQTQDRLIKEAVKQVLSNFPPN